MSEDFFPYAAAGPDAWPLLRMVLTEALGDDPGRVLLFRFPATAKKEAEAGIRRAIGEILPETAFLLSAFDPGSLILVATREAGPKAAATAVKAVGAAFGNDIVKAWRISAVQGDGIACQPAKTIAPREPQTPRPASTVVLGDAEFRYFPIWNVRRNMVFAYQCKPVWAEGDEGDLVHQFADPAMERALDHESLHKAVTAVDSSLDHNTYAHVMVPVHFDTIDQPGYRDRYLENLGRLSSLTRERLYLELVGLPASGRGREVAYAIGVLGPMCQGLLLRTGWRSEMLLECGSDGIIAIGADISHDDRPEDAIMSDLESLAVSAGEMMVHSYVQGVKSIGLSVAAVCAGIDYIGSKAISASLEGWEMDEYLVKPIDLYRKLLRVK